MEGRSSIEGNMSMSETLLLYFPELTCPCCIYFLCASNNNFRSTFRIVVKVMCSVSLSNRRSQGLDSTSESDFKIQRSLRLAPALAAIQQRGNAIVRLVFRWLHIADTCIDYAMPMRHTDMGQSFRHLFLAEMVTKPGIAHRALCFPRV